MEGRQRVSIHTPTKGVTWVLTAAPRHIRVSIHTPTKGVTWQRSRSRVKNCVSIHTPTKGVTNLIGCRLDGFPRFNPHTHEGCDSSQCSTLTTSLSFNPHTHEGCDSPPVPFSVTLTVFQSTHPRRVWLARAEKLFPYIKFQSTHPRRVWLVQLSSLFAALRFNPHTHEGCDVTSRICNAVVDVSIHTPTKGVT